MMRYGKTLSVLAVAAVLSLLVAVVPGQPALAAPTIQLSPASGAVGTRVTVTGTNFDSYIGDSLSVFFGPVEILDSPVAIPSDGCFETYFAVPDSTQSGTYLVTVKGPRGSVLAQASFMVEPAEIWPDVASGVVGTAVTVLARGFHVDRIVVFHYSHDGVSTKVGTAFAGPTGECSLEFVIPPSHAGEHRITAGYGTGNVATTVFEVVPLVRLSPVQGSVDDIIGLSGEGFAAGEEVSVYVKSRPVAYVDADASGSFEGVFRVPSLSNDSYAMRVEDKSGNRVLLQFLIVAGVRFSSTAGNVGDVVVASGSGFTAEGTVTARYDGVEVASAQVDETGAFSATFEVPSSAGGQHTVMVSDGADTVAIVFTVESTPPPGPVRQTPEPGAEVRSPVDFVWSAVDDPSRPVTYTVQVANDEGFTDVLLEKTGQTAAEYTPAGEERLRTSKEGAAYYWRVRATDAASNESQWSDVGSFRVTAAFSMPGWAIYVLIGFAVVIVGLLAYRLWRRSRSSYWDQ